jgi:hypothetical protein
MTEVIESAEPTIDEVVDGPEPQRSVADILRGAYEEVAEQREPKAIQLFGYGEPDSELWVTFRMVDDYDEVNERLSPVLKQRGPKKNRLVNVGLEALLMAAVGSYAVIDGEEHDIGAPLGLELYDHLGLNPDKPRPASDRQAAWLLFKANKLRVANAFMAYDAWVKAGGVDVEEEALGE